MTPPPNLESCGGQSGRRLDQEADAPREQELKFLRKIIKKKNHCSFHANDMSISLVAAVDGVRKTKI